MTATTRPKTPDALADGPRSAGPDITAAGGSTAVGSTLPADRGTLTVADRVVERVAGFAVTLVPDATAAPRRVLGVNVGESSPGQAASVDARVQGHVATVDATIAVRWPLSVREVADQVRHSIRDEVHRITGVEVDHIDIDVVTLKVAARKARRVQ